MLTLPLPLLLLGKRVAWRGRFRRVMEFLSRINQDLQKLCSQSTGEGTSLGGSLAWTGRLLAALRSDSGATARGRSLAFAMTLALCWLSKRLVVSQQGRAKLAIVVKSVLQVLVQPTLAASACHACQGCECIANSWEVL